MEKVGSMGVLVGWRSRTSTWGWGEGWRRKSQAWAGRAEIVREGRRDGRRQMVVVVVLGQSWILSGLLKIHSSCPV